MSAFDLLNLPYYANLDEDMLRKRFQTISAELHPDKGGCEIKFREVNQAYQTLRTASGRLKELFRIYNIEYSPRGSVSDDLMDLFMSTGDLLQRIDAHIRKKEAATTALTKALLEPVSMQLQQSLSNQIQTVESTLEATSSTLPVIDQQGVTNSVALATATARNLAFLEKWRAQLRERFGQLF